MFILAAAEFPVSQKLQVQRHHSLPGLIDAAFLLILDGFAFDADVTIDVQDGRDFSRQVLWLIENGRRLKTRHDLVAELPHPVSRARCEDSKIFEPGWCIYPFLGPAVKHCFEQSFSQTSRFLSPLGRSGDPRQLGSTMEEVSAHLICRHIRR